MFATKLKALREKHKMTQQELADALNLSLRTISNYETANVRPRYRRIYDDISRLFNVPVGYLLTEKEDFQGDADDLLPYGHGGSEEAQALALELAGLFAGGSLDDADKKIVFETVQLAYFKSRLSQERPLVPRAEREEDDMEDGE